MANTKKVISYYLTNERTFVKGASCGRVSSWLTAPYRNGMVGWNDAVLTQGLNPLPISNYASCLCFQRGWR